MKDDTLRLDLDGMQGALVSAAASVAPLSQHAAEISLDAHPRAVQDGDLALCRVAEENGFRQILVQSSSGRTVALYGGDLLVGVLGMRQSTTNVLGELPRSLVGRGARLHLLSEAGVVGEVVYAPPAHRPPIVLELAGLLAWKRTAANLSRWRGRPAGLCSLPPVILVAGTATGIGKTTLTCRLINTLVREYNEVVGSIMLSGSGGKADMLAHHAAGARFFHSFIEAGLGSSYGCPAREFVSLVDGICHRMANEERPSVIVGELGGDLLWGNNEAVIRHSRVARHMAGLFLVSHDTLGALGASQLLASWGISAPRHHVVSWTQNHAAMSLRFRRWLDQEPIDPSDRAALGEVVGHLLGRWRRSLAAGE